MLKARFAKLLSSSFGKQVATVASGTMIAQAIPVLMTPVLTRLYAPVDMGILGLYTAFISFLANAVSLGYSQAIVTGRDDDDGASLMILSALVVLPMSILGGSVLLMLSLAGWLGYGVLPPWTSILMTASLALTGVFFTMRYWLVRLAHFRTISQATVAQSVGRISTQIAGGLLGLQWIGLVLGEVIGRGFGLGRLWHDAREVSIAGLRALDMRKLRSVALEYRKFPLYTAPSSLLNALSLVAPVPLIAMHFGTSEAGQFAIASRVMILPLTLVGTGVGDVFHSRIAGLSRTSPDQAVRLFRVVVGGLATVAVFPAMVVALWGKEIVTLVLGSEWTLAGAIAVSIVPWVVMQFIVSPVSRLVQVYQGQELKVVYDIIAMVSVVGVLTYGGSAGLGIVQATALLGWSQAAAYGIYFLLLLRVLMIHRYINVLDRGGS